MKMAIGSKPLEKIIHACYTDRDSRIGIKQIQTVFFTYQKISGFVKNNLVQRYQVSLSEGCQLKSVNFPENCFIEENWNDKSTFTFYAKA